MWQNRVGARLPVKALSQLFRVALSNHHIVKVENDQVTFRYKTNSGQTKFCTLPAEKFIHRSLRVQHVLPKSFVKVRYYGLFSPALRKKLTVARSARRAVHQCPHAVL